METTTTTHNYLADIFGRLDFMATDPAVSDDDLLAAYLEVAERTLRSAAALRGAGR